MADTPLAPGGSASSAQLRQEEAADGNDDSRSRTRFDDDAAAGGVSSFGSSATTLGAMKLTFKPALRLRARPRSEPRLEMMRLTSRIGRLLLRPERTRGSKVVLRQSRNELEMPVEILADVCKFIPYKEGVDVAGVIINFFDSPKERNAFRKAFMNGNFSALEAAYFLCRRRRTRKRGMHLLGVWEKHNEELVASYFEVPFAEALDLKSLVITSAGNDRFKRAGYFRINPISVFRNPHDAICMDHPDLLLRTIRHGPLDVFGDNPYVRGDDGDIILDCGVCSLILIAMEYISPNCLSVLLDLAKAQSHTLTFPDGNRCLLSVMRLRVVLSPDATTRDFFCITKRRNGLIHHYRAVQPWMPR